MGRVAAVAAVASSRQEELVDRGLGIGDGGLGIGDGSFSIVEVALEVIAALFIGIIQPLLLGSIALGLGLGSL